MSDNMNIYNSMRKVPPEAQKEIKGGRLSGYTDINPMWRIKALTEQFGPCGVGWYPVIKKSWLEPGANGEIAAFVEIDLFYKLSDEWSMPVTGTGGSSFVAKEKSGLYVSDECFKMAYTDAISVSAKLLGVGADIYFAKDRTKYDQSQEPDNEPKKTEPKGKPPESVIRATKEQIKEIFDTAKKIKMDKPDFDITAELKKHAEDKAISTVAPYGDKEGKIINWTQKDYEFLKAWIDDKDELPF